MYSNRILRNRCSEVDHPKIEFIEAEVLLKLPEVVTMFGSSFNDKTNQPNIQRVTVPNHVEGSEGNEDVNRQEVSGNAEKMKAVLLEGAQEFQRNI